jgi:LysM repeat protein
MNALRLLTLSVLLSALLCPVLCDAEEFLLYTPKEAAGDQAPASPKEGVLVKRITVQCGDTLKKLSKQHIGVASYFPQVLVFNTIKNPDLIHPGEKLLVPVHRGEHAANKKAAKAKKHKAAASHQTRRHKASSKISKTSKTSKPAAAAVAVDEQESYQQAKRAYLNGDYQRSLELFDSFLRRFPRSTMAADASLYRADCLLRLSSQ